MAISKGNFEGFVHLFGDISTHKQFIKEEMENLFLFFLLIFHGGSSTITRVHIHVNSWKNWADAQSYCRQKYKDLSTVSSTEENERLRVMLENNHAWIGMYRNSTNLDQFIWSDGDLQTNFYNWKSDQPNGRNSQHCVEVDGTGWADYGCENYLPFFCYMTLERDKKTWGEAVEHCRDHYTELASLTNNEHLQQAENNLMGETSVWVGLRFVAGQWYWLNTESVGIEVSLPWCPAAPYLCGARNIVTTRWENRDCNDKLSFLCR